MINVALAMGNITHLFTIYYSIHQKQIPLVGVVKNEIPLVWDGLLYSEFHHIYIDPIWLTHNKNKSNITISHFKSLDATVMLNTNIMAEAIEFS